MRLIHFPDARSFVLLLLLSMMTGLTVTAQQKVFNSPGGDRYRLSFNDEFEGRTLNTKKWKYRTDSKHWSTQLPENVALKDGFLYLMVKKQKSADKDYTGAGIITHRGYGYGYYEARFKMPPGAGWHTSFWLMQEDGSGGTATAKATMEYDICENDSRNKTFYELVLHNWKLNQHIGHKVVNTPDLSADFHTWGCEVLPDKVIYYFDSQIVQTIDSLVLPDDPVNIWLTSIASFLGKTTAVDDTQLPAAAIFDYVRYYRLESRPKVTKR